jgi:hypothetical protein
MSFSSFGQGLAPTLLAALDPGIRGSLPLRAGPKTEGVTRIFGSRRQSLGCAL